MQEELQSSIASLESVVLYNFKSFGNSEHYVGPFVSYTSIIGPNGGGKSNIVDAICFALNINLKSFRQSQLRDFIFRKLRDNPSEHRTCYVQLKFRLKNGRYQELRKVIKHPEEIAYLVDGSPVTESAYNSILVQSNIIPQAKNFLMMQGETDSLATSKPEVLTTYFENLSGSIEYKEKYDELCERLQSCKDKIAKKTNTLTQLKGEKRKIKLIKQNNEEYQKLLTDIQNLEVKIQTLDFFSLDQQIEDKAQELEDARKLRHNYLSQMQSVSSKSKSNDSYLSEQRQAIHKLREEIEEGQTLYEEKRKKELELESDLKYNEKLKQNHADVISQLRSKHNGL